MSNFNSHKGLLFNLSMWLVENFKTQMKFSHICFKIALIWGTKF